MRADLTFTNQNLPKFATDLFQKSHPKHTRSMFMPNTFQHLSKPAQIVRVFSTQTEGYEQLSLDINKCRTDKLLNNNGDYPVFGVQDKIEAYAGDCTEIGWYYLTGIVDEILPTNNWHSNHFCKFLKEEGIQFEIKYQYLATDRLPYDYYQAFTEHVIELFPDTFKGIVNNFIGCLGKHVSKSTMGYIELDEEIAQSCFWQHYDEGFGNISVKTGVSQKMIQIQDMGFTSTKKHKDLYEVFPIDTADYNCGVPHPKHEKICVVQKTKCKKMLTSELPVYNKMRRSAVEALGRRGARP
jgi:hypothetical protein